MKSLQKGIAWQGGTFMAHIDLNETGGTVRFEVQTGVDNSRHLYRIYCLDESCMDIRSLIF